MQSAGVLLQALEQIGSGPAPELRSGGEASVDDVGEQERPGDGAGATVRRAQEDDGLCRFLDAGIVALV